MIVSFCCVGMRIDMFFSLKISWIHLRQYLKDPAWGIVCLKNKRIGVQQFPHEHLKISRGYKVFSNLSSKRYLFWLGQQGGLVFSYVFFFQGYFEKLPGFHDFWKLRKKTWRNVYNGQPMPCWMLSKMVHLLDIYYSMVHRVQANWIQLWGRNCWL